MYCIYCGKELKDGEICTCRQPGSYNQTPVAPQPVIQPEQNVQTQQSVQPQQNVQTQPGFQTQQSVQPQPGFQPQGYVQPYNEFQFYTFPYGGPGTYNYNRLAALIGSPFVLVFGILNSLNLLFSFIRLIVNPLTTSVSVVSDFAGICINILLIIAAFMAYSSARTYMTTGQPIKVSGLTLASGLFFTKMILSIVATVIVAILFIYSLDFPGSMSVSMALVGGFLVLFGIVYYLHLSRVFRSVRYMISGMGEPAEISALPPVLTTISTVFSFLGLVIYMILASTAEYISQYLYRSMNYMFGFSKKDFASLIGFDIFQMMKDVFTGPYFIFTVLSLLVSIASGILAAVILFKARKARAEIKYSNY